MGKVTVTIESDTLSTKDLTRIVYWSVPTEKDMEDELVANGYEPASIKVYIVPADD